MDMKRKYSKFDLLRFLNFAKQNPSLERIKLLKAYDESFPELSDAEKLKNIKEALGITVCIWFESHSTNHD